MSTEKCRSEEDLKSMDSHNKITRDMLQPKIERSFSDEEGSSDYLFELSDNDSDTSDIGSDRRVAVCVTVTMSVTLCVWLTKSVWFVFLPLKHSSSCCCVSTASPL